MRSSLLLIVAALQLTCGVQLTRGVQLTAISAPAIASPRARTIVASVVPDTTLIQGGSLRTFALDHTIECVEVGLSTEGRPLDADIELWTGPDNTPCKMRVYVENAALRPFSAVIETPRGSNSVAIRNIGQMEFPIKAEFIAGNVNRPVESSADSITIQGGALRTFPFDASVESVLVAIETDGRPLNARIELIQGPNNNKEVIEVYTEDGLERPFFCVLESPGAGNVVRILNTNPVEFPMSACVEAGRVNPEMSTSTPVLGGDEQAVVLGGAGGFGFRGR